MDFPRTGLALEQPQPIDTAMDLITNLNLSAPDDFYAALVESHKGLSLDESNALNARLILLLANHVGTQSVLLQALEAARNAVH